MTTINLYDMAPPQRFEPDNKPFIEYALEGSVDGLMWAAFESGTLAPAYTDPAKPPTYNFTSIDADPTYVYFRVTWKDDDAISFSTMPMVRPQPLPAWAPALGDVASFIISRTKTPNGVYVNTFTDRTNPTNVQVEMFIAKAVEDVVPLMEYAISDPNSANSAKNLAAMRAAMLVELNLFSNQINTDQSPYQKYKDIWDDETGRSKTSRGGGQPGDVTGHEGGAVFVFPVYHTMMEVDSATDTDFVGGVVAPGAEERSLRWWQGRLW